MRKHNMIKSVSLFTVSLVLLNAGNSLFRTTVLEGATIINWQNQEDLQQEIEKRRALLMQNAKPSPDEEMEITKNIEMINIRYGFKSAQISAVLRKMGNKAIPEIEKRLRDKDVEERERAVIALVYLLKPAEHRKEEDKRTEEVVTLLLVRSVSDAEPVIRSHALSILGGIAYWSAWPEPMHAPPILIEVFRTKLNDKTETDSVRQAAAFCLFRIGRETDVPEEMRSAWKGLIID